MASGKLEGSLVVVEKGKTIHAIMAGDAGCPKSGDMRLHRRGILLAVAIQASRAFKCGDFLSVTIVALEDTAGVCFGMCVQDKTRVGMGKSGDVKPGDITIFSDMLGMTGPAVHARIVFL